MKNLLYVFVLFVTIALASTTCWAIGFHPLESEKLAWIYGVISVLMLQVMSTIL